MPKAPKEREEQQVLAQWFDIRRILHTKTIASADFGAMVTNPRTKPFFFRMMSKLKKDGYHKGIPDHIAIVDNKCIFVELKRKKGGTLKPEQKQWMDAINNCTSVHSIVANGFVDAQKQIHSITEKK